MPHYRLVLLLAVCISLSVYGKKLNPNKFPKGFMFGTATSAYQVEGGWNENGKGENIWDRYTRENSENILDGSNGNVACDSYHKLDEDIVLLKDLGANFYHFSLSWSRILPKGFTYKVNSDGIRYYNELISLLVANNIIPMITMFHSDTPQPIEEMGGFANVLTVDWFEEYARLVFENFGDRVKYWITFSEPRELCQNGYGGHLRAPAYNASGVADYMCAHNILKSHAKVYHLYNSTFKSVQKGKVSIALGSEWYEPDKVSNSNKEAAERLQQFSLGWFADPIYHPNGDYPNMMKKFVAKRSAAEEFPSSRLPQFSKEEVNYIKGTYDYFALNHYTTLLAADIEEPALGKSSMSNDYRASSRFDSAWPQSAAPWLRVVPWGLRKILNWIKTRYGKQEIIITGNGYSDPGEIDDQDRINYHTDYLSALLDAIYEDKINVTGYAVWSLIDSFEWGYGYTNKFGIYHVDFSDPDRSRKPKASAVFYKEVIAKRVIASSTSKQLMYPTIIFLFMALFYLVN